MTTVNIGGVPEHFNLSWYLTLKNGEYKAENINLRWQDYPSGTGSMNEALRSGEIDMAVILTEGIIKDIAEGNPSKIVQVFVETPLIWGIHVAADSKFESLEDLKGKRCAISRYGSGSHLMAYVNAEKLGWDLESDLKFEVIQDLDGAVDALKNGKADYFMWEKFMTKPIVDSGVFRRIAECPTPWPCFVIAVRNEFLESNEDAVKTILKIINKTTSGFKQRIDIDEMIANRYDLKIKDVQDWLNLTEWSQQNLQIRTVDDVQIKLQKLEIISEKKSYETIVKHL